MDIQLLIVCVITGFCAMLSGGFWGLGGGWLIMPALLLYGVNIETAVAASLMQMVPSTLPTVWRQAPKIGWGRGSWGLRVAIPMCFFSFIGSLWGKPLADFLFKLYGSYKFQESLYLIILLITIIATLFSVEHKENTANGLPEGGLGRQFIVGIAGMITGLISSLLGIGGGSIVRPVLKIAINTPEKMCGMILRLSVTIVAVSGSLSYFIGSTAPFSNACWLALALTVGGLPAFILGTKMHSVVLMGGNDWMAGKSFALFAFFIMASVFCKLIGYIIWGRIIIVVAGTLLFIFIFALTSYSSRKKTLNIA
jgi:uncharacterized membrane protein YfcA